MPFFFKISDSYEPSSLKAAIAIASFAPITFQTTTITQKMYVITKHVKRILKWTKTLMSLTKCKNPEVVIFVKFCGCKFSLTSTKKIGIYLLKFLLLFSRKIHYINWEIYIFPQISNFLSKTDSFQCKSQNISFDVAIIKREIWTFLI